MPTASVLSFGLFLFTILRYLPHVHEMNSYRFGCVCLPAYLISRSARHIWMESRIYIVSSGPTSNLYVLISYN
jgi:hypothetical protein